MEERPVIICLTPVKNEAWILDRFLQCASLWADHIIIADQGSTDGSVEIAEKYPKVRLIANDTTLFHGTHMRGLLLAESRKIQGKKLLIALDADEVLEGTLFRSNEWNQILTSAPGTRMRMRWANIFPDYSSFYSDDQWYYIGFMDDGVSMIEGGVLHEPRLPFLENNPAIDIASNRFLHYNYLNRKRNASKLRWYMCYERIINKRSTFSILQQYYCHHHPEYLWWKQKKYQLNPSAFQFYYDHGIEMQNINQEQYFWWDKAVLTYLIEQGGYLFKDLDIWYTDWNEAAHYFGIHLEHPITNPQQIQDRIAVHVFKGINNHPKNLIYRIGYRLLRMCHY